MRLYKDPIMTHGSCKHPDIIEWFEREIEFSAAIDTRCRSLLGEEHGWRRGGEGWTKEEARIRASITPHRPRRSPKTVSRDAQA